MPKPPPPPPTTLAPAAVRIFATNQRLNQILLENLDPSLWKTTPPGKVRTIAAIFTHMHNVRTKWIRLSAPHLKVPAQLNRANCTPEQARAALTRSAATCEQMLAQALSGDPRVRKFRRTVGALPGPQARKCSAICSPTKPTTADKPACSPTNSGFRCPTKSHPTCGTGKNSGINRCHPERGEWTSRLLFPRPGMWTQVSLYAVR